jgi:processing peptidase subunit beta
MLSKAFRPNNINLFRTANRSYGTKPGILHRVFNTLDKGTHAYSVARFNPSVPLKGHRTIETSDVAHEYNVTNLTNGFTVLTESQSFPGAVHMGFLMDVGTRDETAETSGALLALKNTYLKTLKHTNETINYGMI